MSNLAAVIPVVSWLALNAATGILLTIPFPRRDYVFPTLLIPAAISLRTLHFLAFCNGLPELWGLLRLGGLIHFSSLLYIKRWIFREVQRPPTESRSGYIWLHRKHWTRLYKLATNPRFVKVPYKDVVGNRVKSTAIHARFASRRISWLFVKVAVHQLFNALVMNDILGGISMDDFVPVKSGLLRRSLSYDSGLSTNGTSVRETVIRFWFAASSIWTAILVLDCIHAGTAVIFIYLLRTDTPDEWPDLFGSSREAYTVGRFWSHLWHRIHLSGYSDYATLLLPGPILRNAVAKRVSMIFAMFLFSALIHQVTSLQLHPQCIDFGDLQFFSLNAAAVCLEAGLTQVLSGRRARKWKQREGAAKHAPPSRNPSVLVRCIGYVWVVAFFAWASPKCYYSRVHCILVHDA